MHDKPQTFLTVVDKTSVHRQVLHGVAIRVRSFEFTTGVHRHGQQGPHLKIMSEQLELIYNYTHLIKIMYISTVCQ